VELIINEFMSNPEKISDVFLITKKFNTSNEFSQFIERRAHYTKSSCIDIIIDFCLTNEIEIESIHRILTISLKDKIQVEAQDLNLLKIKRSNRLQF
jgi:hypothetical protein